MKLLNSIKSTDTLEKYFSRFRENIIGIDQYFESPYGRKKLLYSDWTASGRLYGPIEEKMAHDFGPLGVRVNAIAPGAVDSSWQIEWGDGARQASIEQAALKRVDDVAHLVPREVRVDRQLARETIDGIGQFLHRGSERTDADKMFSLQQRRLIGQHRRRGSRGGDDEPRAAEQFARVVAHGDRHAFLDGT